jgi:histidinol dehydrogenase
MKIQYFGLDDAQIFSRQNLGENTTLRETVMKIIEDVRKNGDPAVQQYTQRFDHTDLACFEVTDSEWEQALKETSPDMVMILTEAADNIRDFHRHQLRKGFTTQRPDGSILGQIILPLERVGLYIPGGTASYPSTVLMNGIPAQLAGCEEIIMITPPNAQGEVSPALLTAASLAGVHRVFKVGGAQAIAALAYGTETIPKVDKIVGPGNWYVSEAKRQVFGDVAIDMIAGPSEIVIVADESCPAAYLAADLLSQAEHDASAMAVLITDSVVLAKQVLIELDSQLINLPRKEIATRALEHYGKIVVVKDIAEALVVANRFAPEHLELCVEDHWQALEQVKHAGSVFLGAYTPEPVGDYWAGTNHTLPTAGSARFSSPLSVDDFLKKTQFIYYSQEQLTQVANKIARFAEYEGLQAHSRSISIRSQGGMK